jgi:hypothetical protein
MKTKKKHKKRTSPPLYTSSLKDSVLQVALGGILKSIFHPERLDEEYGVDSLEKTNMRIFKRWIYKEKRQIIVEVNGDDYLDRIPHKELMGMLRLRVADKRIIFMIMSWIRSPTLVLDMKSRKTSMSNRFKNRKKGIPRGIYLQEILCDIFFMGVAKLWEEKETYKNLGAKMLCAGGDLYICSVASSKRVLDALSKFMAELNMKIRFMKVSITYLQKREPFFYMGHTFEKNGVDKNIGTLPDESDPYNYMREYFESWYYD